MWKSTSVSGAQRRGTGTATLSSRRRVDGVEGERAVNLISTQRATVEPPGVCASASAPCARSCPRGRASANKLNLRKTRGSAVLRRWPRRAAGRRTRRTAPAPRTSARVGGRTRRGTPRPVWKSKFYGAFALNRRVDLHAIDATSSRWRGDVGSSPLDGSSAATSSPRNDLVKNYRVRPTLWLISTQAATEGPSSSEASLKRLEAAPRA